VSLLPSHARTQNVSLVCPPYIIMSQLTTHWESTWSQSQE